MAKTLNLNDCVKFNDKINNNGIWATTEVIGGYGEIIIIPMVSLLLMRRYLEQRILFQLVEFLM